MTDVLVVANQVSLPVKIGWLLWLAWVVVQVVGYRWARVAAPAAEQPAPMLQARLGEHSLEETSFEPVLKATTPGPPPAASGFKESRRRRRAQVSGPTQTRAIESIGAGVEKTVSIG